jgi:steroid 5-alpha reductase family enzyme
LGLTYLPSDNWWLKNPTFFVGIGIFLTGFAINIPDHILRNLRGFKETGYKIPLGGLFRWVSSPNYLGEIIEWSGFLLATWSLAALVFVVFTFANLAPRAWAHRKWYLANFPDYPERRKALIPWIF